MTSTASDPLLSDPRRTRDLHAMMGVEIVVSKYLTGSEVAYTDGWVVLVSPEQHERIKGAKTPEELREVLLSINAKYFPLSSVNRFKP